MKGKSDELQMLRTVAGHAYLDEAVGAPTAPVDGPIAPTASQKSSVEVAWKGPGEVTLRFIDVNGQAVLEETYTAAGTPDVQFRTNRPTRLGTREGQLEVAPVVVSQSASIQSLTLDAMSWQAYVRQRCEDIGCSSAVADAAYRGVCRPLPRPPILTTEALRRHGILPR
jgi:hypothetical protein